MNTRNNTHPLYSTGIARSLVCLALVTGAAHAQVHHTFNGLVAGDALGSSVAGVGDVNQDGFPDVIVGAPTADPGGRDKAGTAYIFSGKDWTELRRFNGLVAGDLLGSSVAGAGDVNQDGFPDVIVGATGADPDGRYDAGSAYIFSGKNGMKLRQFDGAAAVDYLGVSVAGAGDVNQDGFADVIVGAYTASPDGKIAAGSAYIFSGKNGMKLRQFDGVASADFMGCSVAGVGDVNQDGIPDVIVGAWGADPDGVFTAGSAYVFSGKNGKQLRQFNGVAVDDRLGTSVAGAGDVNQDGIPDIIVGAPAFPPPFGITASGSALVYSGKNGTLIWKFNGTKFGDAFGSSVAGAGDVNQDGFPDLIVGAWGADPGGRFAAGSAYVFSGRNGKELRQYDGAAAYDMMGTSVAGVGGVNQDGFADVIVGAWQTSPGGKKSAGSAYVYGYDGGAYISFGTGCAGSVGVPVLEIAPGRLPRIDDTFTLQLSNLPAGYGMAYVIFGFSKTQWAGGPLPLDLGPLGMPGCDLYVSLDFDTQILTFGSTAQFSLHIPDNPALVGFRFFNQALVYDPLANNAFKLVATNACEAVVGR